PSPSPVVASTPSPPSSPALPVASASAPAPRGAKPGPVAPSAAPTAAPRITDDQERRVEASGTDLVVAFSNRGARLLAWQLQGFRDARGRPEEMVPAVREAPYALDLETGQPEIDARLRAALFRAQPTDLKLGA